MEFEFLNPFIQGVALPDHPSAKALLTTVKEAAVEFGRGVSVLKLFQKVGPQPVEDSPERFTAPGILEAVNASFILAHILCEEAEKGEAAGEWAPERAHQVRIEAAQGWLMSYGLVKCHFLENYRPHRVLDERPEDAFDRIFFAVKGFTSTAQQILVNRHVKSTKLSPLQRFDAYYRKTAPAIMATPPVMIYRSSHFCITPTPGRSNFRRPGSPDNENNSPEPA